MEIKLINRHKVGEMEFYSMTLEVVREDKTYNFEVTEIISRDPDGKSVTDYSIRNTSTALGDIKCRVLTKLREEGLNV